MSITVEQLQGLTGKVYSQDSQKIGGIGEVYLDDESGQPTWVTTKTGLFGSSESFAPLEGARIDGDDIYLAFDQDKVKSAPRIDPDGSLSPQEEDELYQYYGLSDSDNGAQSDASNRTDALNAPHGDRQNVAGDQQNVEGNQQNVAGNENQEAEVVPVVAGADRDDDRVTDRDRDGDRVADRDRDASESSDDRRDVSNESTGRDRSETSAEEGMTRSEERLNVGTETRESGRARLRKHVTTETVTQEVPVSHEEVTLDRQPITDAQPGGEIGEDEHEVTLHEEVPVVDKDVVAVERVQLGKETKTENQTVSEDIRKEQVEMVQPDSADRSDEVRSDDRPNQS